MEYFGRERNQFKSSVYEGFARLRCEAPRAKRDSYAEILSAKRLPSGSVYSPPRAFVPVSQCHAAGRHSSSIHTPGDGSRVAEAVAHDGVYAMVRGAEAAQLDVLAVCNLFCVRVAPLDGHVRVGVGVDEHVEGAVAAELGQEGDGRGDLAEDGGDFGLDLGLGLVVGRRLRGPSGTGGGCVFLVLLAGRGFRGGPGGLGFRGRLGDLDLVEDDLSVCGDQGSELRKAREKEGRERPTSNCHRSTCSPVSLSVITMTSLEILPPTIHLSSWDMIFLM